MTVNVVLASVHLFRRDTFYLLHFSFDPKINLSTQKLNKSSIKLYGDIYGAYCQ